MAFTAWRTFVAAEVITAAIMNQQIRDNGRYMVGNDGVPTIESGLVIDNTDGDEYLKLPLLSTAECTSVLNAEGEVAFDEQTHDLKWYNGSAVISAKDPATLVIASQAAADVLVASSSTAWKRMAKGAASTYMRMNSGGTDLEWAAAGQAIKIWVPVLGAIGTGVAWPTSANGWPVASTADNQSNTCLFAWPVPTGFSSLTKAVVLIWGGAGDVYRSVTTRFGAEGEAENANTDSIAYSTTTIAAGGSALHADDVSAAFTGIAAGDYGQLSWIRDATNAADTVNSLVYVVGLLLEMA